MARRPSADRDWQVVATATALLAVLFPDHRTPETPGVRRRLRLVLCGAARTVWHRLPHDDLRRAVEVAERFADGRASKKELDDARRAANGRLIGAQSDRHEVVFAADRSRHFGTESVPLLVGLAEAEYAVAAAELIRACCDRSVTVARIADRVLAEVPRLSAPPAVWEAAVQTDWLGVEVGPDPAAAVVRDLFGGPTPVRFPDDWKTGTATAVAAGIAEDGAFDRLPVLADALEDAGCDDDRVLAHCRGPGPHWRGCWVVDGVLGS
jgi:hypothetical protein